MLPSVGIEEKNMDHSDHQYLRCTQLESYCSSGTVLHPSSLLYMEVCHILTVRVAFLVHA